MDTPEPEFSWRLISPAGTRPGCALQVATGPAFQEGTLLWDSGTVQGDEPFGLRYAGAALQSLRTYWWRVRLTGDEAQNGAWSEPACFETGILDPALWKARWIGDAAPGKAGKRRALYLRGTVELPQPIIRARACVTALGWYRFFVNGEDLTGPSLVPRFTPFDRVVEYQVYDVTRALGSGTNVLAMAIGDGRFRGAMGLTASPETYGTRLAGFVQIQAELADGSTVVLTSDDTWQAGPGRILVSDPMLGETADLRIPDADWLTGHRPPAGFRRAAVIEEPRRLISEEVGRVTAVACLPARHVTRSPSGRQIIDFGQNFAGIVRIRLDGPAGSKVRLTHSEVLKPDGELDIDYIHPLPFRRWAQRDEVVLDGQAGWWSPWFTIHGFRYVEVEGHDQRLEPDDAEGIVLSSDLPAAGEFNCSDSRLTRLRENVRWSLLSNFTDTPTDCPTRERAGWTGDIQAFAPTATTIVDVQAYLRRYLRLLAIEQLPGGPVPIFIPAQVSGVKRRSKMLRLMAGSAGWGDAAVLLPWTLYRHYGDHAVLERQFASMAAWVDHLAARARRPASLFRWAWRGRGEHRSDVIDSGFDFGEWIRPAETTFTSGLDGLFRGGIVATAYLEHSARILGGIAVLIGREDAARHYTELSERVRTAWRATFLHADGRIGANRQDDYVRALAFGLLEPEERGQAITRLVALIEAAGYHLGTGFLSTPMLLPVLADHGRADVAWQLLLQTSSPSWLHLVERGATTIWESWEGNAKGAGSQNHYAFGAVANFLTAYVAGLAPAEPGYKVIDVRPEIGSHLRFASASVKTPYGQASSSWRRDGDRVTLDIVVPPGTTARVRTGDGTVHGVSMGQHRFEWLSPC